MKTPDPVTAPPGQDTQNRLRELFDQAVELPPSAREGWIDAQPASPAERAALRRLLAADDSNGFLDTPATEHAARLAAEEVLPHTLLRPHVWRLRLLAAR